MPTYNLLINGAKVSAAACSLQPSLDCMLTDRLVTTWGEFLRDDKRLSTLKITLPVRRRRKQEASVGDCGLGFSLRRVSPEVAKPTEEPERKAAKRERHDSLPSYSPISRLHSSEGWSASDTRLAFIILVIGCNL
jgi:hypothetical protein